MNVSLTTELETLVQNKVKSGNYTSASEVIREGLRLLKEQDQLKELRINELRAEIQKGVDAMNEGRFTEITNKEEADALVKRIVREGKKELKKRKLKTR